MPHAGQKRASGGTSAPHDGHGRTSRVPHDAQKRAPSSFSAPQDGQGIATRRV
jgi:hypothetical protein